MAKYKKGDKVWVCSVYQSNGCVLKEHVPPTEIILNDDINNSMDLGNAMNKADWQGAKGTKRTWLLNIYKTEKEAKDYYVTSLVNVNKRLTNEIDRIQGYIKRYEGFIANPPTKHPAKKVKTNIEI